MLADPHGESLVNAAQKGTKGNQCLMD